MSSVSNAPKVSAVLPIYNGEDYLEQCLDSILAQTLDDIEVICVNDGSKDSSLAIMGRYAAADPRVHVVDKPNGGYGAALNRGVSEARGEYVSIIEPDDFIDEHMYEDLYAASHLADGARADVVKGSYWEYYDAVGSYHDARTLPNLNVYAPNERRVSDIDGNIELLCHHPSIWSAIYRHGFLSENDIHFVEPKGAGWADNPFFLETLVLADTIVWVPSEYYYYRQTNAAASSFLKDFHIPFDRLREMRAFLATQQPSPAVMDAFYGREFDYVFSVIGEFGFDEHDPEVEALIRETFESMDADAVLSSDTIESERLSYFVSFMGLNAAHPAHRAVDAPDLTVIVPAHDDHVLLDGCLSSIQSSGVDSLEVIIADCGSHDRTRPMAEAWAAADKRMSVVDGGDTIEGGINVALGRARGSYILVLPCDRLLCPGFLPPVLAAAVSEGVDVVLFGGDTSSTRDVTNPVPDPDDTLLGDTRRVYGQLLIRASGHNEDWLTGEVGQNGLIAPFKAGDVVPAVFNLTDSRPDARLVRRSLVQARSLSFVADDLPTGDLFFSKALLAADDIGFVPGGATTAAQSERVGLGYYLGIANGLETSQHEPHIVSALALGDALRHVCAFDEFEQSWRNLVLSSFMSDLATRYSPSAISSYLEDYSDEAGRAIDLEHHGCRYYHDARAFDAYQMLVNEGPIGFFEFCYLRRSRQSYRYARRITNLLSSARFHVGDKVVSTAKAIAPTRLIGQVRKMISASQER